MNDTLTNSHFQDSIIVMNKNLVGVIGNLTNHSAWYENLLPNIITIGIALFAAIITIYQVRLNIVSTERIKQIGDLRLMIPEFLQIVVKNVGTSSNQIHYDNYQKSAEILRKVKLYLDTKNNLLHFETYILMLNLHNYSVANRLGDTLLISEKTIEVEDKIQKIINIKWKLIQSMRVLPRKNNEHKFDQSEFDKVLKRISNEFKQYNR